ncbi:MAG TPA: DUF5103 domain-containing protein [Puia sp.]|jgi:hypothetical protein
MKFLLLFFASSMAVLLTTAQVPDSVYAPNIRTPQLYKAGNQLGYPVLRLNGNDQVELHFDDVDGDVKNYYYTYQLCNNDWTPAVVSEFDFIRGFSQVRIASYQVSSVALTHYTHYQALLPDPSCLPIHSGNYLVKIFLDADTSKLVFTRRLLVVDGKINIAAQILQPQNPDIAHTHQRLIFKANATALNPNNPLDQIKVVILQNHRWDNAIRDIKPTFYVNNSLDYNNADAIVFPGGSEWRWLDLQSFRYQSDRIQNAVYGKTSTEIFVRPDGDRSMQPYLFYKDYDGFYFIQTTESISPLFQTDYATVHFNFTPPDHSPWPDKDVYLLAKFTGGVLNDSTRMVFNAEKGRYELSFQLKQGYYNYAYVTVDRADPDRKASFEFTEGNHIETENGYTILMYYRALGARADELVGMASVSSLNTFR